MGATMSGKLEPFPRTVLQISPVHAIPASAPMHAINRSRSIAPANIGAKKRDRAFAVSFLSRIGTGHGGTFCRGERNVTRP